MNDIERFQAIVDGSDNIVFFGGAGVSTESGIPDFRSTDGLYHQKYDYPPETILSAEFYYNHTEEFFRFYRDKLIVPNVKPNKAHIALARLEKAGKLKAVITQNIDGLHQTAGSQRVYELHGSVLRNYCENCGKAYGVEKIAEAEGIPVCDECGGRIKPDVVLYGEVLDNGCIRGAAEAVSKADTLIIGGTSLVVYPAAGLVNYFKGRHLVLINKSRTPADSAAELVIHAPIGEVLGALKI